MDKTGKEVVFPTLEEGCAGKHFEFMGFDCWWTGWKQTASQIVYGGQWVAYDQKTGLGYAYSLPGRKFMPIISLTHALDMTVNSLVEDQFRVVTDKKYRTQMVRQGKRSFKRQISEHERRRMMDALDERKQKEVITDWSKMYQQWVNQAGKNVVPQSWTTSGTFIGQQSIGAASTNVPPGGIISTTIAPSNVMYKGSSYDYNAWQDAIVQGCKEQAKQKVQKEMDDKLASMKEEAMKDYYNSSILDNIKSVLKGKKE